MSDKLPRLPRMSQPAVYRQMYFSEYGEMHTAVCFWCNEEVEMVYALTADAAKEKTSGIVHHIDHNHDNDVLDNLAPMHQNCHVAYHRSVRPLVAKGSKLPDEWRERVAVASKMNNARPEVRQKIAESMAVAVRSYENYGKPLYCEDCGSGPYVGELGLRSHQGRGGCAKHTERIERERTYEFECSCGKKFAYRKSLTRHLGNNAEHFKVRTGLTAREREKANERDTYKFICECGRKVPSKRGLAIHKGTSCPLKENSNV